MKIHILSDPGYPSGPDMRVMYFPYDVYKFIRYHKDIFEMIHYGLEGSQVDCEHYDLPRGDLGLWNIEAQKGIARNKSKNDVILCFGGNTNQAATIGNEDCYIIEPHIGYSVKAVFAPYRVFTSYAQLHHYYGMLNADTWPSWYDAVIPNGLDPSEFVFREEKKDYVLYMGRVIQSKGVDIAIQATERAGKKLVIAGSPRSLKELGYNKTPKHVELIGHASPEQRKKLLANAECLIAPTYYVEPFGLMVIEAHMSGTPTITSNWGAFPETNPHGVTGYRCNVMKEFVWALNNTHLIDKKAIHKRAIELYSDDVVYGQMTNYINRVIENDFYGDGDVGPSPITHYIEKPVEYNSGEVERNVSVIIPTMWRSEHLSDMIDKYIACPSVGEVLVVDNDPQVKFPINDKARVIYSGPNIYVNPAWNMAAKEAKCEYLLFANDDILLDDIDNLLVYIKSNIVSNEVIGLDVKRMNQNEYSLEHPQPKEYYGWGCFFMMKKEYYVPIPDDIKIWCGDNTQWVCNQPLILAGAKGKVDLSVTINSGKNHFEPIMRNDWVLFDAWYKKRFSPKKILHVIMSCGRPDYLKRSLDSVLKNIDFGDYEVHRLLIDDWPDTDTKEIEDLISKYNIDEYIQHEHNVGLSGVWNKIWDMDLSKYSYILHQEDDVLLLRPIHIQSWIDVLTHREKTCSAVLLRQPWYKGDMPPMAKDSDAIIGNFRVEYNHLVFSPMFTLYEPWVAKENYTNRDSLNEGLIMRHLEAEGYKVADMKDSNGENLIEHIGEVSQGKIMPIDDRCINGKYLSRTGKLID
jgi:glycosyltransferase involved in cell wall biosynthesis/GT2 family glycosyltransferase